MTITLSNAGRSGSLEIGLHILVRRQELPLFARLGAQGAHTDPRKPTWAMMASKVGMSEDNPGATTTRDHVPGLSSTAVSEDWRPLAAGWSRLQMAYLTVGDEEARRLMQDVPE